MREKLAEKLKFFRLRSKLKIDEVGEVVGKSGKTVSAWEKGRGQPDADMLIKLCSLYKVKSIGEFFGEEPITLINDDFNDKDKELIKNHNLLNDEGQKMLENYVKFLLSQDEYKKFNQDLPTQNTS